MLDEIKSFFDELRAPLEWPDHFPSIDPISGDNFREVVEKHHRFAMLALDKTEFHLLEICRAGTDSFAADFLDQVMAIIRRRDSAEERMRAIGCFLRQRERTRASGGLFDTQHRRVHPAIRHGITGAVCQSRFINLAFR
jgi:hypothetical protein